MAAPPEILVVDDEADIAELVSYNLKKEGFSVRTSPNAEDALRRIRRDGFDLIVLDLMLPGMHGNELTRVLKADSKTAHIPVIMLTAKGEEVDRVLGLELGADDYVTKPFSVRELVARVKAVLRRGEGRAEKARTIEAGDLVIDREDYTVAKRGRHIELSSTEFKLLLHLAENRGRVLTREQLLSAVWRDEAFVEPRTVDVHIRRLRAQIEDDPSEPRYIKTRRGIGYCFEKET